MKFSLLMLPSMAFLVGCQSAQITSISKWNEESIREELIGEFWNGDPFWPRYLRLGRDSNFEYSQMTDVLVENEAGDYEFEGFVSDPIMPGGYTDKKAEIVRLTEEMTRAMESIIRRYPEQYLWIHNRWKTYKGKKPVFSND